MRNQSSAAKMTALTVEVQKDPCTRGCCCNCCMECSREACKGLCGIVRKRRSLHELFNLKWSDLQLGKCTRQEFSDSGILHTHVDRHMRWNNHTWYSGSHQMPDGTYAYLYLTGPGSEGEKPVYQTQAWKDWVVAYRSEFWKDHFYGNDYQPLCAKDCGFCLPHCACGELFHGMKLVDRKLVPAAAAIAAPQPATVPVQEPSCVVCGKPAEDDLPYCSLQCECQAKYEENEQWQEYQDAKMKEEAVKKENDDDDEIQQLMRLRK